MFMALRTLLLLLFGTGAAHATEGRLYDFEVTLDGRPIGTHRYEVIPSRPGSYEVSSRANFDMKLFGVVIYRYRHEAREQVRDGCLERIEALTRDNGESMVVRGGRREGLFRLDEPAARPELGECVLGYAYWDPKQLLRRSSLLNPQTGEVDAVAVRYEGRESLSSQGAMVAARRYSLRGSRHVIDLWYSDEDEWLQLESQVRGGRLLRYSLRD